MQPTIIYFNGLLALNTLGYTDRQSTAAHGTLPWFFDWQKHHKTTISHSKTPFLVGNRSKYKSDTLGTNIYHISPPHILPTLPVHLSQWFAFFPRCDMFSWPKKNPATKPESSQLTSRAPWRPQRTFLVPLCWELFQLWHGPGDEAKSTENGSSGPWGHGFFPG